MDFLKWLSEFNSAARSQLSLDHTDLCLDVADLQRQFEAGIQPSAALLQVQEDLQLLPFAEFALSIF